MKLALVISVILVVGCKNSAIGKIETRKDGHHYLVNTNRERAMEFTVRTTVIIDDSIYHYSTQIVQLAPGDEEVLDGPYMQYMDTATVGYPSMARTYPSIATTKLFIYDPKKIVESLKNPDPFMLGAEKQAYDRLPNMPDTIIEGRKLKYEYVTVQVDDSLHPYPTPKYSLKYEVTGFSPVVDFKKEK